jgi:hypothetical protein
MSTDLQSLISTFRPLDDRENSVASFRTLVPWVGPEAYLNIIYRPAPHRLLLQVAERLRFPPTVIDFLQRQNGAILFSGSLSLYGVVEAGQLLSRQDGLSLPPFNIERENATWQFHPHRLLVVGGYAFDGSRACIDRSTGRVHLFKKKEPNPKASWPNLDHWLTNEIGRLRTLFDDNGRRIAPESETGPPRSSGVDWS